MKLLILLLSLLIFVSCTQMGSVKETKPFTGNLSQFKSVRISVVSDKLSEEEKLLVQNELVSNFKEKKLFNEVSIDRNKPTDLSLQVAVPQPKYKTVLGTMTPAQAKGFVTIKENKTGTVIANLEVEGDSRLMPKRSVGTRGLSFDVSGSPKKLALQHLGLTIAKYLEKKKSEKE